MPPTDLVDWRGVPNAELLRSRLKHPRLTDKAKIAALIIADFSEAWFSIPWLADAMDCSPSTARAALQVLEELGISVRHERPGRTSRHELIHSPRPLPHRESGGDPAGESAPKLSILNSDLRAAQEACHDLVATLDALDSGSPVSPSVSQVRSENEQSGEDAIEEVAALEPPSPPAAPPARLALVSTRPAKAKVASISQPTLLALIAALGTDQVVALERGFCDSRWRAPGVAESACRLLLKRMQRKRVQYPRAYVEELYAEALERAPQCAELLERERLTRSSHVPRLGREREAVP